MQKKDEKILIIQRSGSSELIFASPVIRVLKTQQDSELHFLLDHRNRDFLEASPYLTRIHHWKSYFEYYKLLKKEHYDRVINLDGDLLLKILTLAAGNNILQPKRLALEKWLRTFLKIDQLPNQHITDRFMEALKKAGFKQDPLGLEYFIPEKDQIESDWIPDGFRNEFVMVSLHADYATRQLPANRLVELCDRINKPIILTGEDRDFVEAEKVEVFFKRNIQGETYEQGLKELNKKSTILNWCGKLNRNQTASLIRKARYVFCHDSWVLPVASAFRKEIFSIWGNTIPLFGNYPYHTKFKILENNRISCRPCSVKGFSKCPEGHLKCLNEILFDFYIPD